MLSLHNEEPSEHTNERSFLCILVWIVKTSFGPNACLSVKNSVLIRKKKKIIISQQNKTKQTKNGLSALNPLKESATLVSQPSNTWIQTHWWSQSAFSFGWRIEEGLYINKQFVVVKRKSFQGPVYVVFAFLWCSVEPTSDSEYVKWGISSPGGRGCSHPGQAWSELSILLECVDPSLCLAEKPKAAPTPTSP